MKKWPQQAYTELRQENVYEQPRNRRINDPRFYTSMQEQIYLEVYRTFMHPISPQKYINLAAMENNPVYFGEALEICKRFGLTHIMQLCNNYDEKLIIQFYTTVHFGGEDDKTLTWMTKD